MGTCLGLSQRTARVTARVLLLALGISTFGPMLHGAHDPDLSPFIVAHDESLHHFQAAPATRSLDTEHCLACHFVRSSRGPASWEPSGVQAFAPGHLLFHSDGDLTAAASVSPLPARAPPTV